MSSESLKATVRQKYGEAALRVMSGAKTGCCGTACCGSADDPITSNLYTEDETGGLPEEAVLASLGCGNPTALAELHAGEMVLDLGSGGGIDVLLSARRVGPTGKAYGLDMTDEMLALARENQRKAGVDERRVPQGRDRGDPAARQLGGRDHLQLRDQPLGRQGTVLGEAFRVLKPGGRFAVSDVVVRGEVPAEVRRSMELWVGCVAGALNEEEFQYLPARGRLRGHRHRADADLRVRGRQGVPRRGRARYRGPGAGSGRTGHGSVHPGAQAPLSGIGPAGETGWGSSPPRRAHDPSSPI